MSSRGLKVAIFLYNFSGLLNHTFKNSRFSFSKVKILINFTNLVSSLFIIYIFSTNKYLNNQVFRSATSQFKELSTFFRVSSVTAVSLLHLSGTVFNLNTKMSALKVNDFLNKAVNFKCTEKTLKNFEKRFLRHTVVICIIYGAVTFLKFLAITKFGFTYFLIFLVFVYPTLIGLGFATFVKGFEIFVVELLHELEDAIVINCSKNDKGFEQNLIVRHGQIHKLVEDFNHTFGDLLTTVLCTLTILIVLYVSCMNNIFGCK